MFARIKETLHFPHKEKKQVTLRDLIEPFGKDVYNAEAMIFGGIGNWRRSYTESQRDNIAVLYPGTVIERRENLGAINIGMEQQQETWRLSSDLERNEEEINALPILVKIDRLIDEAAKAGYPKATKAFLSIKANRLSMFDPAQVREKLIEAYKVKINYLGADLSYYLRRGREYRRQQKTLNKEIAYYQDLISTIATARE